MGSTSYARKPHSESPLNHMGTSYWSSKAALNMQVGMGLKQPEVLRSEQHPVCSVSILSHRASLVRHMCIARHTQH